MQDDDVEIKEEPLARQQPIQVPTTSRSMALGGYIAPTIDWTQDSQLPDRLEDFKRECLTLFGLELKDADDNAKALRVIQWAGEPGKRQFKAWNVKAQDLKIDKVWEEFEKFANRTKNFMRARFDLMKMQQKKDEPADVWYQRVQAQLTPCGYKPEMEAIQLRDNFVLKLTDQEMAGKISSEIKKHGDTYTANQALEKACELQQNKAANTFLQQTVKHEPIENQVLAMRSQRTEMATTKSNKWRNNRRQVPTKQAEQQNNRREWKCKRCGGQHQKTRECPAANKTCHKCGRNGHFARACLGKSYKHRVQSIQAKQETDMAEYEDNPTVRYQASQIKVCAKVNQVKEPQEPEPPVDKKIVMVTIPYAKTPNEETKNCLRMRVDTCADINIMPLSVYQTIFDDIKKQKLLPTGIQVTTYNDSTLDLIGRCTLYLQHPNTPEKMAATFYVTQDEGSVLLSCSTSLKLEVIEVPEQRPVPPYMPIYTSSIDKPKLTEQYVVYQNEIIEVYDKNNPNRIIRSKQDIKKLYPSVFTGIGKFPGEPYQIQLDPNVPPRQMPYRPVPMHLEEQFNGKIKEMEETGVIKKVLQEEFTPWISSYVLVETTDKDGKPKLRICLDPSNLNKAVIREPYKYMVPDELSSKLAGATAITVVDCSKGYWHEELTEESSLLTTFNCSLGRYRFTRMPFGVSVAGDVFQRKLDECIRDIRNVYCIADDIMVVGYEEDHSDHDKALTNLFQRAEKCNLKFNLDKIQYKKKEVSFFGETYTTTGRKPDPGKVEAIRTMKQPENKKELQSFLGLCQYLTKFTPELASLSEPLRFLTRKNAIFEWTQQHTRAFDRIKQTLTKEQELAHFDPEKETVIQTDASIKGLGACLLQEGKPVYYASRAIGEAEKNYVAIELESLAVAWAFEKLHHFIYGKKFKLQTDQKPLATILSRSQNASTPRLQRLLNRAFQYDFDVEYIKGETNVLADCLSRLGVTKDHIKLPKAMVHSVSVELPATKDFLDRVRTATRKDQELQLLTQQVRSGWPKKFSEVDAKLKCYWSFREDIMIADDILVKGHRIIVPSSMREYMLEQVHEGHFGMDKCKMRMSNCCYWPSVNKDIERMIRNCPTCLEFAPAKPRIKKKDMLHHEIPHTPWTKLATDIFYFQGTNYLVLVDYTSKFPVVKQLRRIDQRAVITAFEEIFAERGYPDELVSDNGPCYRGEQFREFLKTKGIKHTTSSPYYPQSNGLAEAYVKVVKNMMKKAQKCKVRFNDMMYQYRTSPVAGKKESPIELLEQRRPRTNMPHLGKGNPRGDPKAKTHNYPIGIKVMYRGGPDPDSTLHGTWYPARITSHLEEPRSYLLENNYSKIVETHRTTHTPVLHSTTTTSETDDVGRLREPTDTPNSSKQTGPHQKQAQAGRQRIHSRQMAES